MIAIVIKIYAVTLIHEKTGWLTPPDPSPEELIQAIKEINPQQAISMRNTCEKQAMTFCTKIFIKNMREIIY